MTCHVMTTGTQVPHQEAPRACPASSQCSATPTDAQRWCRRAAALEARGPAGIGIAMHRAADEGMAVLLVEQHIHKALQVADRVLVMTRGKIALEGRASDLVDRLDDIQDAYLRYGTSDPAHGENEPSGGAQS